MSRWVASQTSFIGGEISPRLHGQVGTKLYKAALALARNVMPTSWHSACLAPGSRMKQLIPGAVREVPFRRNGQQDQHLVLGGGVAKLFDESGAAQVVLTGVNLAQNGGFDGGLASWTEGAGFGWEAGKADTAGGRLNLRPVGNLAGRWQAVTLDAPAVVRLSFRFGEITIPRRYNTTGLVSFQAAQAWVHPNVGGQIYSNGYVQVGTTTLELNGGVALPAGTYYLWLVAFAGEFWFDDVEISTGQQYAEVPIPWTDDQLPDVHWISETGSDRTLFFHPAVAPWFLQRLASGTWDFGDVVFTNTPREDASVPVGPPLWRGDRWPGTAELWQGRLYVGGVRGFGNRLMASKVGSIFDFGLTETVDASPLVTAACGIDEQLSTKGTIRWMRGRWMLLVGTDLGEGAWTTSGQAGGAVTPLDFNYRAESAYGAAAIQAEDAGDQVLYVSRDGRKVRALAFQLEQQAWSSKDVTYTWEHLTEEGIREVHFARDPHPTLLLLLSDGTLAACTYDSALKQAAGWRRTTQGRVRSLSVSHGPSGSIANLLVERPGGVCLERMPFSDLDAEAVWLDSAVAGTVPAGGLVGGLEHLEGAMVRILVDQQRLEDQVVAGGQVTIPTEFEGQAYQVGLGYQGVLRQLQLEPGGGSPGGPASLARRRQSKVRLRLNRSALPLVNGRAAPERLPSDPMDTATDLVTRDVDYQVLGFDGDGALTITMDQPYRTEIVAIFGAASSNEA